MTPSLINYWRNTLADIDALQSPMQSDHPHCLSIGWEPLASGTLSALCVSDFFPENPTAQTTCAVWIAPGIAFKTTDHQQSLAMPSQIIPLWVPARLTAEGVLSPDPSRIPWVSRMLLAPTDSPVIIDTLQAVDRRLSETVWENADWERYLEQALHLLPENWVSRIQSAGYQFPEQMVRVVAKDLCRGAAQNIIRVYDHLLSTKEIPPLFQTISETELADRPPHGIEPLRHTGHVASYPLAQTQRQALAGALTLKQGEMLGINGPPGTGKTTLLQDFWASLWVDAAVRGTRPPVFVVASTNNQALQSVLANLTSDIQITRWLPEPVRGFGLLLTNQVRQQESAALAEYPFYGRSGKHSKGMFNEVESGAFLAVATPYFLERVNTHVQSMGSPQQFTQVSVACQWLRQQLLQANDSLQRILNIASTIQSMARGDIPDFAALDQNANACDQQLADAKTERQQWIARADAWSSHLHLTARRSLLPWRNRSLSVEDRACALTQQISDTTGMEQFSLRSHVTDHINEMALLAEQRIKSLTDAALKARRVALEAQSLPGAFARHITEGEWRHWVNAETFHQKCPDPRCAETESPSHVTAWLDATVRRAMLEIASHYWEGRWLMEAYAAIHQQPGFFHPTNAAPAARAMTWSRYAMLTPCIVTTLHSGPGFFTCKAQESNQLPHLGIIDWLVIDEAGQVSPEIAGGMIALAHRAVIIGDQFQIQPIVQMTEGLDAHNAIQAGVITSESRDGAWRDTGISPCGGTILRIAQRRSGWLTEFGYEPGLTLSEHRRCVDPIAAFCNDLAYQGRLIPLRGYQGLPQNFPWPHLGFYPVTGTSEPVPGGSLTNPDEARAIVGWIHREATRIADLYPPVSIQSVQVAVSRNIGIITPFRAQAELLKRMLLAKGYPNVLCGTVHALQGTERPVILFSSVYGTGSQGPYFFDQNVNLLNVAVSRARDAFLVFGDPHLRQEGRERTPWRLLSSRLVTMTEAENVVPLAKPSAVHIMTGIHAQVT
ncbi:hypothetical protein HAP94_04490 [Acidithiobacillus ferrivorans]|nr:hypothetical protein [Acidithiobacillus ferrivorans]